MKIAVLTIRAERTHAVTGVNEALNGLNMMDVGVFSTPEKPLSGPQSLSKHLGVVWYLVAVHFFLTRARGRRGGR